MIQKDTMLQPAQQYLLAVISVGLLAKGTFFCIRMSILIRFYNFSILRESKYTTGDRILHTNLGDL